MFDPIKVNEFDRHELSIILTCVKCQLRFYQFTCDNNHEPYDKDQIKKYNDIIYKIERLCID